MSRFLALYFSNNFLTIVDYFSLYNAHCSSEILVYIPLVLCLQEAIFRTLAAILHLGNIEFSPGKEHDSSTIKDQKSNFHLQMSANLFK